PDIQPQMVAPHLVANLLALLGNPPHEMIAAA
ncbi:octanoyltransferase, partial [Escherichia coli]|nr:octanoyltransferase [Escherichia coli]